MTKPNDVIGNSDSSHCSAVSSLNTRAGGVQVAHPLFFQVEGGGSIPTSALKLRFEKCSIRRAIELNRTWHSVLPKVDESNILRNTRQVCYLAQFDGIDYAAAIWTSPVARLLNNVPRLELRRLAIGPDAPKNTATRMLMWMRGDVKKRWPELVQLVSYQDMDHHQGTIYKASGWTPAIVSEGGEWSVPSRHRKSVQSAAKKQRWEWNYE